MNRRALTRRLRVSALASSAFAVAGGFGAGVASAQDDDDSLEEIYVTGTRIRRTEYDSTTAVQSVTREDMERLGLVSASDMLAQLPANVGNWTLDTNDTQWFVGDTYANLRGMNTFFGTRTLTLVDGQRQVTTTNGGGVGMSFVPSILISRMETVTGGASATYGSDATAGVVNIILDRNVDGMRLDASYGEDGHGDFRNYSVSMATGIEVLNGRGDVTFSLEHQQTDPVASCGEVREWCRRSMEQFTTYQNRTSLMGCNPAPGTATSCPAFYLIPEAARWFPDKEYAAIEVFEGARYLHHGSPYGTLHTSSATSQATGAALPNCTAAILGGAQAAASLVNTTSYGSTACQRVGDAFLQTFYQFNAEGTDVTEFQSRDNGLDGDWRYWAYEGANNTVFAGEGPLKTMNTTMRSGQERNNIYTRFNWDITDDVRMNAQLSYGKTEGDQYRNSYTNHQDTLCIALPIQNATQAPTGLNTIQTQNFVQAATNRNFGGPNGFFSKYILPGTTAYALMLDRGRIATDTGNFTCTPDTAAGLSSALIPARPGVEIQKNWKNQLDLGVTSETEVSRISMGLNGPMFDGRWTWNTNLQYGESDRTQLVRNAQHELRWMMAFDSVLDPAAPDSVDPDGDDVVCRINATAAAGGEETREQYRNWLYGENAAVVDNPNSDIDEERFAEATANIDALRDGCVPLNPFGLQADPAALAFAYGDTAESSGSDQLTWSGSMSGEFWKGFGAGPLSMAAGIDYRREDTINAPAVGTDPTPIVARDFNSRYSDPWGGGTRATEVFTEFELPLVRDRAGAEYIMANFSGRRTLNNTFRNDPENTFDQDRYSTSWRASFVWQPINWLRVRATRSGDVRSPAPRELFFRRQQTGGGVVPGGNLTRNPWRLVDPNGDYWDSVTGSNATLGNEGSTTETLGLVITPGGWAQGLQLSIDYSELTVKSGIALTSQTMVNTDADDPDNLNLPYTLHRCYYYNDPFYCDQIEFDLNGSTEETNDPADGGPGLALSDCPLADPCVARTEILSIAETAENSEPYWTRNLDLSASYRFQLEGGGGLSIRMQTTRGLEQNRCASNVGVVRDPETNVPICPSRINFVGITGQGFGSGVNPGLNNYQSQPRWAGNAYTSYSKNAFTITGQFQYTGAGEIALNNVGPEDPRWCANCLGTSSINDLPSWTTLNLTTGFNFARSNFAPERWENLQLTLTITNLFDKQPDFYSGSGTGGVNTRFFNGTGRTFRLNFRSAF